MASWDILIPLESERLTNGEVGDDATGDKAADDNSQGEPGGDADFAASEDTEIENQDANFWSRDAEHVYEFTSCLEFHKSDDDTWVINKPIGHMSAAAANFDED